jgi:hypothetical protein
MIKRLTGGIILLFFLVQAYAVDAALFPDIKGWKKEINEKVYNSGDLWELINGAADIFLSYNFEDLQIADYSKKDQMIRVELYRHKSFEDTYGIYTAERMPDYPQVPIGSQGYKSQGVLNFMAGNYYVKIMSAGVEEPDEQTIALFAETIDDALKQPQGLPGALTLFPKEGQVFLSDNYIAQNFLGYSFFKRAFTAKYEKPSEFQLFVINMESGEIQLMLEQYYKMVKAENIETRDGLMIIKDPFNGIIYLKHKDNFLVGVVNTDKAEVANEFIDKVFLNTKNE